jgi:DNA-binding LytR/AlgR family response regulator
MFFHERKNGIDRYVNPRFVAVVIANHNFMTMISADGSVFRVDGTLTHAYEAMVQEELEVIRVHNSYVINLDYVKHIQDDEITFVTSFINALNETMKELVLKISVSESGNKNLQKSCYDLHKPPSKQ